MWDERYGQSELAYGTEPNEFLVEVVERVPVGKVLDLGAGQGRNGLWLAKRGHTVTCVDASPVGLARAQAMAAEAGLEIETTVADLARFEIEPTRYDGIVSIWCHMPPEPRRRLHRACVEGLRPGGAMVLVAYTPAQVGRGTGGPPVSELCVSLDDARRELAGLEMELGLEVEREVHEGEYHDGMSAVLQVLARKPGAS